MESTSDQNMLRRETCCCNREGMREEMAYEKVDELREELENQAVLLQGAGTSLG